MTANLGIATGIVADTASRGADAVLLPENGLMLGTAEQMRAAAVQVDGPVIGSLCRAAAKSNCAVVVGGVKCRDGTGAIHNSALVLGADGRVCGGYDKIRLFEARLDGVSFEASRVEEPGHTPIVRTVRGVSVGLTICYDLRFPELYRSLALAGAEVFFVPAAFAAKTGPAYWEPLLRARAIENGASVVASATGSHPHGEDAFPSYGHALAADPWGTLAIVEIDTDAVARARSALPVLRQLRPDAYARKPTAPQA